MENKETNTDPIPSNEGEYLVMVNELKKQFDEEKAKWKAKFIVLEKQNKEMRKFIGADTLSFLSISLNLL